MSSINGTVFLIENYFSVLGNNSDKCDSDEWRSSLSNLDFIKDVLILDSTLLFNIKEVLKTLERKFDA